MYALVSFAQVRNTFNQFRKLVKTNEFVSFAQKTCMTGIVKPAFRLPRIMTIIEPDKDLRLFDEYEQLVRKKNLKSLNTFQLENGVHYVVLEDDKVVAGMTVIFYVINRFPGMLCASVEMVVSNKRGCGKLLFYMLKNIFKKRKHQSWVCTLYLTTHLSSLPTVPAPGSDILCIALADYHSVREQLQGDGILDQIPARDQGGQDAALPDVHV